MSFGIVGSMGLILLVGFLAGLLFSKIKLPPLVGMIIVGILMGPTVLNILDPTLIGDPVSSSLRQIALVIILTRSGLNLDLDSLKKVGRPAILMCFLPAVFEITGVTLGATLLLDLTIFEGLLLGSVLAAVSPAIVSPRMIRLIENKYGSDKKIPELILAGSSVDDIFVIVLFYGFLGLNQTGSFDFGSIALMPVSIILGILLGFIVGFILSFVFKKTKLGMLTNIIIVFSSTLAMVGLEYVLKPYISISSLLGVIIVGMILLFRNKEEAKDLSKGYNSMWKVFEIILFVLVGASVNITLVFDYGFMPFLVLIIGLLFRMVGVLICVSFTKLNWKERLFCVLAYIPKATVQASIGGIALSVGLPCGELILAIAVVAIVITAPLGAILIDTTYKKLLNNIDYLEE